MTSQLSAIGRFSTILSTPAVFSTRVKKIKVMIAPKIEHKNKGSLRASFQS